MRGFLARLLFVALLSGLLTLPAFADSRDELLRYFADLKSLEARFEQLTINQEGRILSESAGSLQILRPGRFRWSYDSPYEQLIVTDGRTLWVFDPDLEQVTVSELDTSVGNTPALLLSSAQPLDELFEISGPEADGGMLWLLLEPREHETSFTRIFLGFDDLRLSIMEIVDGFGQIVQIRFTGVRRDIPIDPVLFDFKPPPGIDVIGEGAPPR